MFSLDKVKKAFLSFSSAIVLCAQITSSYPVLAEGAEDMAEASPPSAHPFRLPEMSSTLPPVGCDPDSVLQLNPELETEFARTHSVYRSDAVYGHVVSPYWLKQRRLWVLERIQDSLMGRRPAYSWIPGVPKGFDWREAIFTNHLYRHIYGRIFPVIGDVNSQQYSQWFGGLATFVQNYAAQVNQMLEFPSRIFQTLPNGYDPAVVLEMTPALEARFIAANRSKGLTANHLVSGHVVSTSWVERMHAWLKGLVRQSLIGKDVSFPWVRGAPKGLDWRKELKDNPVYLALFQVLRPLHEEATAEERWVWFGDLATFVQKNYMKPEGKSEFPQVGSELPPRFNSELFLDLNPDLAQRFIQVNRRKGLIKDIDLRDGKLVSEDLIAIRTAWLRSLVRVSLAGRDGAFSWLPGVSEDFDWREELEANPLYGPAYSMQHPLPDAASPSERWKWFMGLVEFVQEQSHGRNQGQLSSVLVQLKAKAALQGLSYKAFYKMPLASLTPTFVPTVHELFRPFKSSHRQPVFDVLCSLPSEFWTPVFLEVAKALNGLQLDPFCIHRVIEELGQVDPSYIGPQLVSALGEVQRLFPDSEGYKATAVLRPLFMGGALPSPKHRGIFLSRAVDAVKARQSQQWHFSEALAQTLLALIDTMKKQPQELILAQEAAKSVLDSVTDLAVRERAATTLYCVQQDAMISPYFPCALEAFWEVLHDKREKSLPEVIGDVGMMRGALLKLVATREAAFMALLKDLSRSAPSQSVEKTEFYEGWFTDPNSLLLNASGLDGDARKNRYWREALYRFGGKWNDPGLTDQLWNLTDIIELMSEGSILRRETLEQAVIQDLGVESGPELVDARTALFCLSFTHLQAPLLGQASAFISKEFLFGDHLDLALRIALKGGDSFREQLLKKDKLFLAFCHVLLGRVAALSDTFSNQAKFDEFMPKWVVPRVMSALEWGNRLDGETRQFLYRHRALAEVGNKRIPSAGTLEAVLLEKVESLCALEADEIEAVENACDKLASRVENLGAKAKIERAIALAKTTTLRSPQFVPQVRALSGFVFRGEGRAISIEVLGQLNGQTLPQFVSAAKTIVTEFMDYSTRKNVVRALGQVSFLSWTYVAPQAGRLFHKVLVSDPDTLKAILNKLQGESPDRMRTLVDHVLRQLDLLESATENDLFRLMQQTVIPQRVPTDSERKDRLEDEELRGLLYNQQSAIESEVQNSVGESLKRLERKYGAGLALDRGVVSYIRTELGALFPFDPYKVGQLKEKVLKLHPQLDRQEIEKLLTINPFLPVQSSARLDWVLNDETRRVLSPFKEVVEEHDAKKVNPDAEDPQNIKELKALIRDVGKLVGVYRREHDVTLAGQFLDRMETPYWAMYEDEYADMGVLRMLQLVRVAIEDESWGLTEDDTKNSKVQELIESRWGLLMHRLAQTVYEYGVGGMNDGQACVHGIFRAPVETLDGAHPSVHIILGIKFELQNLSGCRTLAEFDAGVEGIYNNLGSDASSKPEYMAAVRSSRKAWIDAHSD